MKCSSNWARNKISHKIKIETKKKRLALNTMPFYFDDVNDDRFLAKVTSGFDDGEVYETAEVRYAVKKLKISDYYGLKLWRFLRSGVFRKIFHYPELPVDPKVQGKTRIRAK